MKIQLALIISIVAVFVSVQHASGQDEALEKKAHVIFEHVMSPFCVGRSLNDCPSGQARKLKKEIREELKKGLTEGQVIEEMIRRYGEEFRAVPKAEGFGLLVWFTPLLFVLIGIAVIIARIKSRASAARAPVEPLSPEAQARVEQELCKLKDQI